MTTPSKTITFRLPASLADEINDVASEAKTSPGAWVREQVLKALQDARTEPSFKAAEVEAAKKAAVDEVLVSLRGHLDERLDSVVRNYEQSTNGPSDGYRQLATAVNNLTSRLGTQQQSVHQIGERLRKLDAGLAALVEATTTRFDAQREQIASQTGEGSLLHYVYHYVLSLRRELALSVTTLLAESGKMTSDEAQAWVEQFLSEEEG